MKREIYIWDLMKIITRLEAETKVKEEEEEEMLKVKEDLLIKDGLLKKEDLLKEIEDELKIFYLKIETIF